MARPIIEALAWDDENEWHVGRHVAPDLVHEMVEGHDWVQVRNKAGHPQNRIRLIGREPGGSLITVVLEPTVHNGVWRPITATRANRKEARIYRQRGRNL